MMAYVTDFVQTNRPALADLMPQLAAGLGVSGYEDGGLDIPDSRRYVVALVDGLGWGLIWRSIRDAGYLAGLIGDAIQLSVTAPTTTAASLMSLWSGLRPASHGVLGFSFATGARRSPSDLVMPLSDLTVPVAPTMMTGLVDAGVSVSWVLPHNQVRSGLTRAGAGSARLIGVDPSDVRAKVTATCRASRSGSRSLVYLYERRLDHAGHKFGVASHQWRQALGVVDDMLDQLRASLDDETCLIITGDHGMVDIEPGNKIIIDDEPDLCRGVDLIGGEARLRHLYTHTAGPLARRWRARVGSSATVLTKAEAIESQLFGPVNERYADRIGDVVVMAEADQAYLARGFPGEFSLVGMHGGGTDAERHVPLFID